MLSYLRTCMWLQFFGPFLTEEIHLDAMVCCGPAEEISCWSSELLYILQSIWTL